MYRKIALHCKKIIWEVLDFFIKEGAFLLKRINNKILSKNIIIYKREKIISEEMTACFLVDYRWNTIETFLPVLYWLNEHENWNIISFLPERNVYTEMQRSPFLFKLLCDVSKIVILNQWTPLERGNASMIGYEITNIKKKFLDKVGDIEYSSICEEYFRGIDINAFITEGPVSMFPLYGPLVALYPEAKKISYPHTGFVGLYNAHNALLRWDLQGMDAIAVSDTYWVNGRFPVPLIAIGSPRFDEWWIQRIIVTNQSVKELSMNISLYCKKVILILMSQFDLLDIHWERAEKDSNILQMEFVELRKFLLKTRESILFIFKFHPGDAQVVVQEFFAKFFPEGKEGEDYLISDVSALYLAGVSDAVISVGTCGAVTDGMVSGTPTIELQIPREMREGLYECEDGKGGNFFRWKKLGLRASDSAELMKQLELIFSDGKIWDGYYEEIQKFLILDNHASKRYSNLVIGLCQGKSAEDMRACLSVEHPASMGQNISAKELLHN